MVKMESTFKKTNIYKIDEPLWIYAKGRAEHLGYSSVSEYLFALIRYDRDSFSMLDLREDEEELLFSNPSIKELGIRVFLLEMAQKTVFDDVLKVGESEEK